MVNLLRSEANRDAANWAICSIGRNLGVTHSGRCWCIREIVPYLHQTLGKGFRMDHQMFLLSMEKGGGGIPVSWIFRSRIRP